MHPVEATAERGDIGGHGLWRLIARQRPRDQSGKLRHVRRCHAPPHNLIAAEAQPVQIALNCGRRQTDAATKDIGGPQSPGGRLAAAISGRKQRELMRAFEKYVLDTQAHEIFLLWRYRIVPYRSYVKGWKISPSHYVNQDLATVWLDK